MCALSLLCGMETVSWWAELALRSRVSMSAIGSVMVMRRPRGSGRRRACSWFYLSRSGSSHRQPGTGLPRSKMDNQTSLPDRFSIAKSSGSVGCGLPARLGHAGQLAGMGHLPQAEPAQPELLVDGLRTPAALAAGVGAHGKLRLCRRLDPECSLGHGLALLEREAERPQQRTAFLVGGRGGDDGDVHATRPVDG